MRSREQFKAFVYAKADAVKARRRRIRRLTVSGAAAFCVCICVGSAIYFSGMNRMKDEMLASPSAGTMQTTCATLAQTDCKTEFSVDVYGEGDAKLQDSVLIDGVEETSPAMKNFLYSVNACVPSNAFVGAMHYEILESESAEREFAGQETAGSAEDASEKVTVGISVYYLSEPSESSVTVSYSDEAVTITVFADQMPMPFGSYLQYFTETLDEQRYVGQPILLDFKIMPQDHANTEE